MMKFRGLRLRYWLAIGALLITGYSLRQRIAGLFLKQRTVVSVTKQLKEKRGPEFLKSYPDLYEIREIFLVAVKKTRRLEVWTRNREEDLFQFRKSYPFTGFSGVAGPKRKSGDRQIPEGVYDLPWLNPKSSQHLSVKVGYPNALDEKFAKAEQRDHLGGDIFIHGGSTSIGCIPIGNRNIEELFFLLAESPAAIPKIAIMPVDFRLRRYRNYRGRNPYEKQIYSDLRAALRSRIPEVDLSRSVFSGKSEKKTPVSGI